MKNQLVKLSMLFALVTSVTANANSKNWDAEGFTEISAWTHFAADAVGALAAVGYFAANPGHFPALLPGGEARSTEKHYWMKSLATTMGVVGLLSQGVNVIAGGYTWYDLHESGNSSDKNGSGFEGGYWTSVAGSAVEATGAILHTCTPYGQIGAWFSGVGGAAAALGSLTQGISMVEDTTRK